MALETIYYVYVLAALALIIFVYALFRIFKVRVWIKTSTKVGGPMAEIAYLEMESTGAAAEVKLTGSGTKPAVGRVLVKTDSAKSHGYVEIVTSDINDESQKPHYKQCGYINFDADTTLDEFGRIYKQAKGSSKKELIGYTARPSAPNTPTIYGERTWRTLWLVCTLHAYFGVPNPELDKPENKKKAKDSKKKSKKDKNAPEETTPQETTPQETEQKETEQKETAAAIRGNYEFIVLNADVDGEEPETTPEEVEVAPEEAEVALEEIVPETPEAVEPTEAEVAPAETEAAPEEGTAEESTEATPEEAEVAPEETEDVPEETEGDPEETEDAPEETESAPEEGTSEEPTDGGASVEPAPEPLPEPEPDKFAALSDEEKKRLDNVKATFPKLFDAIIANMVRVEGGTFVMGSDPHTNTTVGEDGKERGMVEDNESPKHNVTLSSYYICKYPVTQAEWRAVMGSNDSDCQDDPQFPVAPVNWFKACDFLLRLSYITGVDFALPTEAQWEYAARGGNRSKGYTFSGSNTFSDVGFSDYKHPVGKKAPNELGIYDMSGLVREWCSDVWAHYSADDQTDPTGPASDDLIIYEKEDGRIYRTVRSPYGNETVSNRKGEDPTLDKEFKSYGFRVACTQLPKPEPKPEPAPKPAPAPKPVPDLSKAGAAKVPAAICHFTGFHRSSKDLLPPEARACAYALLFQKHKKRNYSEFYKEQPYGWRDTALLTTVIFTAIFVVLYLVNTAILGYPLLGNDLLAVVLLIVAYYLLWVIVRFVKIDCIENSNSFQPKLDLFNKNLGLKGFNICAVIMGCLAGYFTMEYYDYDFIPLIWAIVSGIVVNMTLRGANARWIISSTYNENDDDDEEDEDAEVKNPDGDIERNYEWELGRRHGAQRIKGNLTLYFNATDMNAVRQCNPFFAQRKERSDKEYILYMFHFLKEHRTFLGRCKYIVYVIDQYTKRHGLTPVDRLQFTLDFVQEPNIEFRENKDSTIINSFDDYIRYPDETLYDKEGDCNSKSLLAAMLFHIMGYNVLYMASRKQKHAAIGIEVKQADIDAGWYGEILQHKNGIITFNGRKYIFCETTGDEFILGDTIKSMNIDDFEEKVLLPAFDDEDEDEPEPEDSPTLVSRIYNWELDSELGNKLQGNLTLEFDEEEIRALRQLNPFQSYGRTPATYADNVRSIFNFLAEDESRIAKVQAVADYIRKAINEAGYPELDLAQFALDFAQKPNIEYCYDENSQGIEFAKEYMRFPDEVLFDKEGDCDCKSSLTAALFSALGFRVVFMLSKKLGHAAIGIEASEEMLLHLKNDNLDTVLREYNGRRYLYCETTGDGYRIGHIKDGDSIHDFEELVEIHV